MSDQIGIEQVTELLKKGRGRPLLRDLWADAVWDVLWNVHPDGMEPKELRTKAGLNTSQVLAAVRYLRDTFDEDKDVPVVYVRSENKWYIAPTWSEHTRQAIRSEYLQQSSERLRSTEKLLSKAERAFPSKARRIRKIKRNAIYLTEEIADLLVELPA
jgi:hypothetical protein